MSRPFLWMTSLIATVKFNQFVPINGAIIFTIFCGEIANHTIFSFVVGILKAGGKFIWLSTHVSDDFGVESWVACQPFPEIFPGKFFVKLFVLGLDLLFTVTITDNGYKGFMCLLCAFLGGLEVLLLPFPTISIKDRGATFNSNTVNSIILVNSNVNAFCYSFLSARNNDGNRLKKGVAEYSLLTGRYISG